MTRSKRQGNIVLLLLLVLAAAGIGLFLAWRRYHTTFDGVHEGLMVFQSRKIVDVYVDDENERDYLKSKALTSFPFAEVINGAIHDFGVAEPGVLLRHTFKIKNTGNETLELMLEGVTCKCLTMGLEKNKLAKVEPGETFDVDLEWRSDSLTKNFQQYARLKTNDPNDERSQIELKVTGRIVSPVLASPERVSCHLKTSAEPKEFQFLVHGFESKSVDPETFDLQKVAFSNTLLDDYIDYRWEKLTSEEVASEEGAVTGYRVVGTVKAGAPIGTYIGKLSVETSSGHPVGLDFAVRVDAPVEIIPINRKGGSNYYPEAKIIDFGIVKSGDTPELTLMTLYSIKDPDLEIFLNDPPVEPDGLLDVEILQSKKTGAGQMVQLRVAVAKDCPTVTYTGPEKAKMLQVRLKSNSKFAEDLLFFVSFAKK